MPHWQVPNGQTTPYPPLAVYQLEMIVKSGQKATVFCILGCAGFVCTANFHHGGCILRLAGDYWPCCFSWTLSVALRDAVLA
jgi:hypothetical protein